MNETAPPEKQDIDKLARLLMAILVELKQLNEQIVALREAR